MTYKVMNIYIFKILKRIKPLSCLKIMVSTKTLVYNVVTFVMIEALVYNRSDGPVVRIPHFLDSSK